MILGQLFLPHAELKILVASVEERAERRYKENVEKGITADLGIVKKRSLNVTIRDSHRAVSPLKPAADAIHFDTTGVGIADVVAFIEEKAKNCLTKNKNLISYKS